MLYTPKIKEAIRTVKPPNDFIIDIVEYNEVQYPFLAVRFYESQWLYYSEKERLDCIQYLVKIKHIITGFGINVTLEPIIDTGDSLPTNKKVRGMRK